MYCQLGYCYLQIYSKHISKTQKYGSNKEGHVCPQVCTQVCTYTSGMKNVPLKLILPLAINYRIQGDHSTPVSASLCPLYNTTSNEQYKKCFYNQFSYTTESKYEAMIRNGTHNTCMSNWLCTFVDSKLSHTKSVLQTHTYTCFFLTKLIYVFIQLYCCFGSGCIYSSQSEIVLTCYTVKLCQISVLAWLKSLIVV